MRNVFLYIMLTYSNPFKLMGFPQFRKQSVYMDPMILEKSEFSCGIQLADEDLKLVAVYL